MALLTVRRPRLPEVTVSSEAFKTGYDIAQHNNERTGWPIENTPKEDTVVRFLLDTIAIVSSDMATGCDCDYEIRWIAGLFAGWLRRQD